ncbi:LytTR family DNA-binding domain-containing protein [Bacteroidota bacterium]
MDSQNTMREDNIKQLKLVSMISLGMFLFLLFFHPFDYSVQEFNDQLIFVLGCAIITFLILVIFRILLPVSFTRRIRLESLKISNEVGLILLIWVVISTANIFYMRYVGNLELSIFTGLRITLFSAFPSVVLKLADVNMGLRGQLKHAVEKNLRLGHDLSVAEHVEQKSEVFYSESQNDKLEVLPEYLMLVKSADNYVEIVYRDEDELKQKLLRNTLKNIHQQLKKYPEFVRCHRTCIVNSEYILNLTNSYKGHRLKILHYEEEIPVSRQYLLDIKEILNSE